MNRRTPSPEKKKNQKPSTCQTSLGIAPFFAPIYLLNHLILIEIRINKILLYHYIFAGNNKVAFVCSKCSL